MTRQAISTSGAPGALGPYSQAIAIDGFVFCSGQIGIDPESAELADGVEAQTDRALRNLSAVLDAAGLTLADVVKTTIFLADIGDFAAVNAVYAGQMPDPPPAIDVRRRGAPEGRPRGDRGDRAAVHRPLTRSGHRVPVLPGTTKSVRCGEGIR